MCAGVRPGRHSGGLAAPAGRTLIWWPASKHACLMPSEYRPVGPVQSRLRVLAAQHCYLVAQHQELGVLRRRRTRQQDHPASQANEHRVKHA